MSEVIARDDALCLAWWVGCLEAAYAPELNPVELAWRWLESQGIGNRSPGSLDERKKLWRKTRQRFKNQVDVLAIIRHAFKA